MIGGRILLVCVLVYFGGCNSGNKSEPVGNSMVDLGVAPADCGPPPSCPLEANEDCDTCFSRIGLCCYGDKNWGGKSGTVFTLSERCQEAEGCMACCNECAAMTCAELKAAGACPWVEPGVDAGF